MYIYMNMIARVEFVSTLCVCLHVPMLFSDFLFCLIVQKFAFGRMKKDAPQQPCSLNRTLNSYSEQTNQRENVCICVCVCVSERG